MKPQSAAIANYLIERVRGRVDLSESQGDQWITIARGIDLATAERVGFNPEAPTVRSVFGM